MKILLVAILIIFLYLQKSVSILWRNTKINYLLGLYNSYLHANGHNDKASAFKHIAKNRPLSNDLIGGLYIFSPSYDDFGNEEKIRNTYIRLYEARDENYYWAKKYLHPKYLIKDIFFLPGAILGFLFNQKFNNIPSFLVSCLTWTATILISAYATELRQLIDTVIKSFI